MQLNFSWCLVCSIYVHVPHDFCKQLCIWRYTYAAIVDGVYYRRPGAHVLIVQACFDCRHIRAH
jgi:hypothetical protein